MFTAAMQRAAATSSQGHPSLHDPVTVATAGILLRCKLPRWLQISVLGLDGYQWIGLVAILLTTTILTRIMFRPIHHILVRLLQRGHFSLGAEFVRAKLRPLAWLIALCLASAQLAPLDLPVGFWGWILPLLKLAWIGLVAWSTLRFIDLGMAFYTNSEPLQHRRNLSDMIVPTAARFLKLSVLVVATSCVVYLIGSGEWVTRLLAGLGLVGLAASLAAQDTLKNFFGTLLLIGEHPFKLGDYIVVSNVEGTVESVGFRSTWLRTPDDSLITIPNSIIANASIDNRGARNSRRYRTLLGVSPDTPPDRLIALRDSLRAYAAAHPKALTDRIDIYLHTLSSSGVDLLVNLYFKVNSSAEELETRDELNREILHQVQSAGVELAGPNKTLVLAHAPEPGGAIPKPRWAAHPAQPAESSYASTAKRFRDPPLRVAPGEQGHDA
jgi:MscS family membrane protein